MRPKRAFEMWVIKLAVNAFYKYRNPFEKEAGKKTLVNVGNLGKDCRIHGVVRIYCPENLELGDYVRIGKGCFFHCMGGIKIGANTQISRDVLIYSGNHNIDSKAIPYDNSYVNKPVLIGESVWIGMKVCITPGVTIGNGAVIGMGTVVSFDIPPGAVVVGQKAKIIKYRDMENFDKLNKEKQYFGKLWPNA